MDKVKNKFLKYSLLSAITLAFAGLGDAFLYVYLPSNYKSIDISVFLVGIILSVNRFTRLFLNGWIAYHLSKQGLKIVTIAASIIAVATTVSYGFINSIFIWIIVRVLWGITFSTLRLGSTLYAMQHSKQGISLGLSKSVIALGPMLALSLGPVLLMYFERTFTFTILGIVSSISIIMALLLPDIKMEEVNKKELLLSFPSSLNVLVIVVSFIVEGMMVVLLSCLILNDHKLSPELVLISTGFYLSYRRVCLVLFSPLAGWLADKLGFEKMFNYTTVLLTVGVILVAFGFTGPGLIIAFTFAAMNASVAPGGAITKRASLLKEVSDNATWRDIGAACGTLVGALFLDSSYIHTVFMIAIIPLIMGLVLHFNLLKKKISYNGIS